MAQKVQVLLVDDIDGSEATETVSFGLDGVGYEIDLSSGNADELRGELAQYVEHARKSGTAQVRRRHTRAHRLIGRNCIVDRGNHCQHCRRARHRAAAGRVDDTLVLITVHPGGNSR